MAIEWSPEKINACAALFGKLPWKLSVGDKCVNQANVSDNNPEIVLVNSVGNDANEFIKNKVWLLSSDDIEKILLERGWSLTTIMSKIPDTGGLAYQCTVEASNEDGIVLSSSDTDPHFARLKLLQRVFFRPVK